MRNCSKRELPAFLAAHVDPLIRAWIHWFARGPAIAGAGPRSARGSADSRVGPL